MTQEEKAKAYDEALERAKKYKGHDVKCALEIIFPELKESEDEKIIKALLKSLSGYELNCYFNGCFVKDIIAWLKKQGKQKPTGLSINDEFAIKILNTVCDEYLKISTYKGTEFRHEIIDAKNWLKSLRPQSYCIVTEEELSIAKKDAFNEALDKIEYSSGEPTFDDGWNAAISFLRKKLFN